MINKEAIQLLILPYCEANNFFVVDINISASNHIAVFLERVIGLIDITDCVGLSRFIEENLDREKEDFELEVSSAGMESPFKVYNQYKKHCGQQVSVKTKDGLKYLGLLESISPEEIIIKSEEKIRLEGKKKKELVEKHISIKFDQIKETKRVFKF